MIMVFGLQKWSISNFLGVSEINSCTKMPEKWFSFIFVPYMTPLWVEILVDFGRRVDSVRRSVGPKVGRGGPGPPPSLGT